MGGLIYVVVSLLIISAALSVVFYMAWRAFGRPPHALTWSICFAVAAVQWFFNIIQGPADLDMIVYWPIVSTLGAAVPVLAVLGYLQRAKIPPNIPLLMGLTVLCSSVAIWYRLFDLHVGLSLAALPMFTVPMNLWSAWIVYDVPRAKKPVEWGQICSLGTLAFLEIVMSYFALMEGRDGDPYYHQYFISVLFLTLPGAFAILGMFALSLIASDLATKATDLAAFQNKRRLEEKERDRATLQDAIEAIPDIIGIDDGNNIMITCNEAFAEYMGIPAADIIGMDIDDLIKTNRLNMKSIEDELITTDEQVGAKLLHTLQTGERMSIVSVNDRNYIVDCGHMRNGGHILVARDVTELNDINVRLETAINALHGAFAFFDKNLKLVACNKGYEDLLQKPKDWITEQPINTIIEKVLGRIKGAKNLPKGEQYKLLQRTRYALDNKQSMREVVQFENHHWYEITVQPVAAGGTVTLATDITSRRILELDLEKSEAQLREILQGQPFPVLVTRARDSRILFASSTAVESFMGAENDLSSDDARKFLNRQPEIIGPIFGALDTESQTVHETELARKNGERFPVLLSSQLIKYSGIDAQVVSFIDMSTVQRLESELAAQQEALYQSEKLNALGTLLAGFAHELNNPLTVVVANAHVLSMTEEYVGIQDKLQKITDAADRCSQIVRSFLKTARKQSEDPSSFDLIACLNDALDLSRLGLQGHDIDIETNFAPNLPHMEGNAVQFSQVIINLIINAKHALTETETPKTISLSCALSENGNHLELHVSDNGPGIPADIRDKIFEPFFTTKTVDQGTGIGLSLVKGIVESHKGTIELLRNKTGGAHFKILVPHCGTSGVLPPVQRKPAVKGYSYSLLLVDDEPNVLEALSDMLVMQGHTVRAVSNGDDALMALKTHSFDGILSDMCMPDMDGQELYARVQIEFPYMAKRTAFITGNDLSEAAVEFLSTCKRPSLGKPCSPDDITSLLDEMELV